MWDEPSTNIDIELDPAFLVRDAKRKAGQPVEIAQTERLIIRETILSDVPMLYQIWKIPSIRKYVQPMQKTLEEELEFMQAYIHHAYAYYDFGLWTVSLKESGKVIGRAGLFPSEILDEKVELGYMIAPEYQRQGYALECGKAILNYAFDVLDILELHILSDRKNEPSIRTAKKLGFQEKERILYKEKEIVHFIIFPEIP